MKTEQKAPTLFSNIGKKIKSFTPFTKTAFALSVALFIYGILSRAIPINFFWEAFLVSWVFLCTGIIAYLLDRINNHKIETKFFGLFSLIIGFLGFILFVQAVLFVFIPKTEAYQAIFKYVQTNEELKAEVGNVTRLGVIPSGHFETKTNSKGKRGAAFFKLIVKGDKAYKTTTFDAYKGYDTDWKIKVVE